VKGGERLNGGKKCSRGGKGRAWSVISAKSKGGKEIKRKGGTKQGDYKKKALLSAVEKSPKTRNFGHAGDGTVNRS